MKNNTFRASAAFLYFGTNFLQYGHQGAKNCTTHKSSLCVTRSKSSGVNTTISPPGSYKAKAFWAHIKNAER